MSQTRLLIADDHQLLLDGIISLLQPEKDMVIAGTATNGYEVLDLISKNEYDICLLDINMPRLDGIATAKLIKEQKPALKIIVLTTYNDKEIVTEILQAGISGYVIKNSSKQELVKAIRKVAEGGIYFSDEIHNIIMSDYTQHLASNKQKEEPIIFTQREQEVLYLLAKEYTNEKVAEILKISYRTVETHRKNMMQKTHSHNIAGLLRFAYNHGLIK